MKVKKNEKRKENIVYLIIEEERESQSFLRHAIVIA